MAEGGASGYLRGLLESLLCASSEPLTLDKAVEVIGGVTRGDVGRALSELQAEYEREGQHDGDGDEKCDLGADGAGHDSGPECD